MSTPPMYRAAWVPESIDLPYDDAIELAVDWLDDDVEEHGGSITVVCVALDSVRGISALDRYPRATSRQRNRLGPHSGPILAYVPDERTLDLAIDMARHSALCIVEGFNTSMRGWAAAVGALDLTQGSITAAPTAELAHLLERLVFWSSHNFGRPPDTDMARRIVAEISALGPIDTPAVLGYLAAHGVDPKGLRRIDAMINRPVGGTRS